jgi:glycerol dehydrogenase-like iron-containing ADH family enzyme
MADVPSAAFDVQRYATPGRPVGLRAVDIGADAVLRLPAMIRAVGPVRAGRIIVLSDAVPKKRLGAEATALVASLLSGTSEARGAGDVHRVTVPEGAGGVHADERTVAAAAAAAGRDASVIVTVGSGTVADIGWAIPGTWSCRPR